MTNKEQAKILLEKARERGLRFPEHTCDNCLGTACLQPLMFGIINPPTFTGDDMLWGTESTGSLIGNWDYRSGKLVSLHGSFPGPTLGEYITEDYEELL